MSNQSIYSSFYSQMRVPWLIEIWNKNKSVKALFVFKLYFKTLYIFAEYMTGGSLYDYLHKNHNVLELSQLLKFAIDVCKGMEYLHGNNIIHRDLKTANLLMDVHNVWIYWKFELLLLIIFLFIYFFFKVFLSWLTFFFFFE